MASLRTTAVLSALLAALLVVPAAPVAPAPQPSAPEADMLEAPVEPAAAPAASTPVVTGFRLPVDAPLDFDRALIPGAPRDYRSGVHEGLDLRAPLGAPVRAARDGTILRVDREYVEWSAMERGAALSEARRLEGTPPATLDRIRGRQVWIDHGAGVITRYAHLAWVAERGVGDRVAAGEVIGAVGASGLPEGGPHLHFEIRVGDSYLGAGLMEEEIHHVLAGAFSPDVIRRESGE